MPTTLVIIAVSIVVVLAAVAIHLQLKVRALEKKREQALELQHQEQQQQRQRINQSIQILAQSVVDKQVSMTEGSIRISVLLDSLEVDQTTRESYSAFYQLAEATSHIPILEAWKKLPRKDKQRFDKERITIENQYGDFVVDAALRIRGSEF